MNSIWVIFCALIHWVYNSRKLYSEPNSNYNSTTVCMFQSALASIIRYPFSSYVLL